MFDITAIRVGTPFDPRFITTITFGTVKGANNNSVIDNSSTVVNVSAFIPVPGPAASNESTIDFDLLVATTLAI